MRVPPPLSGPAAEGKTASAHAAWISRWLKAVADGSATMSQRAMTAIEAHGGLEAVVAAARAHEVHLVQLTDETGRILVAASREPFTTLC